MQLKKQQLKRARHQLLYNRRAQTLPCFSNSTLPRRGSTKSIKSLNVYCLAEIFEYLDYKDLANCRQVCSYWKECIDFHLARRTHLVYGKTCNNLPTKYRKKIQKKVSTHTSNALLNVNTFYPCEKCLLVNKRMSQQRELASDHSSSPSPSFDMSPSPSLSFSSLCTSPPASPIETDYIEYEFRCSDCQTMIKELQEQLDCDESQDSGEEDLYDDYMDYINMDTLESILSKMPKLTSLKLAQGYHYGRLRQSCLEVSGVNLLQRISQHCPNLTRIDLSNCVGLIETDFVQLVHFYGRQLISVNFSGCRIDESCLRVLVKGCDQLRYLNVSNNFCRLKGGCFEWIADTIETFVADYNQNVRTLDGLLQGKGREIIELELNIGYCFNPTMPYKLIGNHFQDLISLKLTFKSFGKRKSGIFTNLSLLKELECLYLIEEIDDFDSESSLDDESVLAIMKSSGSRLRELYLHAASSLFGRESPLTDISICQIDMLCPQLEVFSIKRASITDASLDSIARLRNAYTVELIDLEHISEEGVKRIMSSFKEIENQEMEKIKVSSGIDISLGQNGPKIEKLKRHSSFTA